MRFVRDALITIAGIVVLALIVTYAKVHAGGLSADSTPGRVEQLIARNLVRLSIPADAKRLENLVQHESHVWESAVDHFEDHCASCHGDDGQGRTAMGDSMYPKVPDLRADAVQRLSDGELFYIIQNGVRWTGMPAWSSEHSPEETWRLVALIRKLPALTPDEAGRLKRDSSGEPHEHHEHQSGRQR